MSRVWKVTILQENIISLHKLYKWHKSQYDLGHILLIRFSFWDPFYLWSSWQSDEVLILYKKWLMSVSSNVDNCCHID